MSPNAHRLRRDMGATMNYLRHYETFLTASVLALALGQPAWCDEAARKEFHLPRQGLAASLLAVGKDTNTEILFQPADVRGIEAAPLDGSFSAEEAVRALVQGSVLAIEVKDGSIFLRGRGQTKGEPAQSSVTPTSVNDIVVTGSRLRGAPIASPVIRLTQKDIVESGQTNMGDVVRTIPQNFGGGQNPGANINVPGKKSDYIGSGSAIDLRGLGGDATLTLLNGHRLAYNGALQSIDVSVIPIAALDRLEVVADGSSALYGSDAVAGVANVVLKRDYNGLNTSARFGAATEGGDQQQEYSVVGGHRWTGGGFMLSYDYSHNSPLVASERSYTATTSPGLTLLPRITQHNVILTGHQALTDQLEFDLDGFYNHRSSIRSYATTAVGDPLYYGATMPFTGHALSIAPSLKLALGSSWRVAASGVYSEDSTFYITDVATAGVHSVTAGCYCNNVRSAELAADGNLFRLPAGAAKLAFGGGFRATGYHGFRTQGSAQNINVTQDTYYAFGELAVPVVAPDQGIPLISKLDLSAAVRYEDYPGIAQVATPKLGIIYAPDPMFAVKASWGKSFKAPTFYERYSSAYASIYNAPTLGGSGYPAGSTVLLLNGGNPDLKPERATTWTVTGTFHPPAIKELVLEVSYFNVQYRNRILAPITYASQSLNDASNLPFVQLSPSPAAITQAIGSRIFSNYAGAAYNPASIVAIVQDSNLNAASQSIHGVDMSASYRFAIGRDGHIGLTADGAYLDSNQRVSATGPVTPLAGTVFNPAHFRGRAGLKFDQGSLTVASFANYVGPVQDARLNYGGHSSAMTTIDLSGHYAFKTATGPARGVAVSLSVLNLFNRAPGTLKAVGVYDTPYDPLNYSPVGRFLNISVSKEW